MLSRVQKPFTISWRESRRPFALSCIVVMALSLLVLIAPGARAQAATELTALHAQDLRLAALADRMLVANRELCRTLMPVSGIIIHSRDQYGATPPADFVQAPVAVAAIVPGSPADLAGLQAGDGLRAIGGTELAAIPPPGEGPLRDAVFNHLASLPPSEPLELSVVRGGIELVLTLAPQAGCRALVEILTEDGRIARSDGRVIQLSLGFVADLSDEGLAASFAHELAHVVLEHRRRLSEAGVSKGFFAEFGSDRRRNRAAEVEADRLSVHLLANAGLDPRIGPRFWRSSEGRRADAGIFRSSIYPSPTRRAELLEEEIAGQLPLGTGPTMAAHLLALRDTAF
jgi:hypothetical protein